MTSPTSASRQVALVISDVDGTLLDDKKQLSTDAPPAVQRLYQRGVRFSIASARPPRMVRDLIRRLDVREPYACFNGALVLATDESILRKYPMAPADAQKVAEWITAHGFDLWVWTDNDWFASKPTGPHLEHHEQEMGRKATLLTTKDITQFTVLKLVGVSDDHPALADAEKEFLAMGMPGVSATRSSAYYLDVTAAEANKGAVVTSLSELLHIPAEQIATIGDMSTDVLMFRKSGTSIAMGNALDDVKASATFVTKTNDENGFAYAMDTFIRASQLQTADQA